MLKPITYGSSHIQAVSFTASGVDARRILTYGQSDNPLSAGSKDQALLFSQKQWVTFPWTSTQISAARISSVTVSGS